MPAARPIGGCRASGREGEVDETSSSLHPFAVAIPAPGLALRPSRAHGAAALVFLVGLVFFACLVGPAASVALAAEATPEQLQFAAQEHDLGYRAYLAKQFDEAATHFENAFFSAPNPAELRSAIRARRDAAQPARAATLAALGQRKYPKDEAIAKIADETLAAARALTFEVHITSPEECNVAVDAKVVAIEKSTDFRFFTDPGSHELQVGWSDDRSAKLTLDATAGGKRDLSLTPPAHSAPKLESAVGPAPAAAPASSKPFGPVLFLIGAGLTAAGAGVTVWSAIDTQNNPGQAAVKAGCVGQGTSCPQYQQGLSSQLRTNVLIAATGGIGLVTAVIGIFFTRWSRPAKAAEPSAGLRVAPVLGPGQAGLMGTF